MIKEKVKYWFILNRKKLSGYKIYQFFFYIYTVYYKFVCYYYSFGSKVVDPACGFTGKAFVNKNSCPKCWSGARHRLLALYIQNILKPDINSLILEIAPNRATSHIFNKYGNYITIDIDSPVAMLHMDLTDLGIKDNKFDLIICYHVLAQIKNDAKAISEIYRVTKPNGIAILQESFTGKNGLDFESDVVNYKDEKINMELYGHPRNVRRYGEKDFLRKLNSIGLNVQLDDYIKKFSDADIAKYGLNKNETLYICHKLIKS